MLAVVVVCKAVIELTVSSFSGVISFAVGQLFTKNLPIFYGFELNKMERLFRKSAGSFYFCSALKMPTRLSISSYF